MKIQNVSVVIPVYNEEACLDELVRRVLNVCDRLINTFELILVDDGSTDSSRNIINKAMCDDRVRGLFLEKNVGQHKAVITGLAAAQGDVVVTLDADLQNPPEEIPKLLEKIEEGFDLVVGVRKFRKDNLFRKIASWVANKTIQLSTGVRQRDFGSMLRAYRRPMVEAMVSSYKNGLFIPIFANNFTQHIAEVEVEHHYRHTGNTKYSFLPLIKLQMSVMRSIQKSVV